MCKTMPQPDTKIHPALQSITFGVYTISSLICAIFISWVLMASIDFAYPVLHDTMDISQHTEKYGPQNRYRNHFENTDRDERIRLFSKINHAIHLQGQGLAQIKYHDKNTQQEINTLLHTSEILHLKDVAILIDVFRYTAMGAFIIWLGLVFLLYKKGISPPNIKQQTISTLGIIAVCTVIILLIGPVNVFYAFHELLFPANHKWFFYYQESLMTILMKAPFLFGYVAILITLLAIPIFVGINMLTAKFLTKHIN
jgi:uncharacterized membrane protein